MADPGGMDMRLLALLRIIFAEKELEIQEDESTNEGPIFMVYILFSFSIYCTYIYIWFDVNIYILYFVFLQY